MFFNSGPWDPLPYMFSMFPWMIWKYLILIDTLLGPVGFFCFFFFLCSIQLLTFHRWCSELLISHSLPLVLLTFNRRLFPRTSPLGERPATRGDSPPWGDSVFSVRGDDLWLPTLTTFCLPVRKSWNPAVYSNVQSPLTQFIDQLGGNYSVKSWAVSGSLCLRVMATTSVLSSAKYRRHRSLPLQRSLTCAPQKF